MSDLIERLRFGFLMHANGSFDQARTNELTDEAADALEAKDKRIAELEVDNLRLTECLKKANAGFEEFERKWYLRGDEIEKLEAERDALKVDAAKQFQAGHAAGLEDAATVVDANWHYETAAAIRAMK